jgi:tetratricopeptide (TPR) repeat protein
MRLRNATVTLFLIASWAICHGPAHAAPVCNVAGVEAEPKITIGACTTSLGQPGLSNAERAGLLKIRARSLHGTGHLDAAIKDYDAALLLAPDDPELHLRRGWTAYDKADFAVVLEQGELALKLKPDYADAYDLVGAALARREVGRRQEAIAFYSRAVEINPENPKFHIDLLIVLECCGIAESALREAEAVLRFPAAEITKPDSIEDYRKETSFRVFASLERAKLLATLGRNEEAKQAYDEAVRDDPGALTYAGRASFLLEQLHAPLDAVQADLDKSLTADPGVWFSHGLEGRVHFYSKDYNVAETEFARSLAIYPINGVMRWWHAVTLRLLGRSEDAVTEAVTAFQVDPGFMFNKIPALEKYGFLPTLSREVDPRPALYDAARACMLDEKCF